jgi:hypothetical protein
MEYLLLILILGIVAGCAIAGYELLDAIERDEDEGPSGWAERARVVLLEPLPSTSVGVSSSRRSGQRLYAIPLRRGARKTEPDVDWLGGRISGLEHRLYRLERECERIEAWSSS